MEEKIIVAGYGGQGILFLGKLICQIGMEKGLYVTYFPSYGAEVRGGTANCNVILSDRPIASPVITKADTLIIMSEPSLIKFQSSLLVNGLLILNSSLVNTKPRRQDIHIEYIPATDIAYKIGEAKVANMVMLGRYIKIKPLFPFEIIQKNLKGPLCDMNIRAVNSGLNYETRTGSSKVCA